jgi:hypothetical protein
MVDSSGGQRVDTTWSADYINWGIQEEENRSLFWNYEKMVGKYCDKFQLAS